MEGLGKGFRLVGMSGIGIELNRCGWRLVGTKGSDQGVDRGEKERLHYRVQDSFWEGKI